MKKELKISKEILDKCIIELNFAKLRGADLKDTIDLIELLIRKRDLFLFDII